MLTYPHCPTCGGNHGEGCPRRRWRVTMTGWVEVERVALVEAPDADAAREVGLRLMAEVYDDMRGPGGVPIHTAPLRVDGMVIEQVDEKEEV